MFDVASMGSDGVVRWNALECPRVRWSWAQFGHKLPDLLDHLVGAADERLREREPEGFRDLL